MLPNPLEWIEAADLTSLRFDKATWIPLVASVTEFEVGKPGHCGHRESYRSTESLIVSTAKREQFASSDWQSINRSGGTDGVWADKEGIRHPGSFDGDSDFIYPVIQRSFDSGETDIWTLQQEIEIALRLIRVGDEWICPRENDVVVAKLNRRADGLPRELLIRAEHLRDYLCAKQAALILCGFYLREAVEQKFSAMPFEGNNQETKFAIGERELTLTAIHEGGSPFGLETSIIHVSRESVNLKDDVPKMPQPTEDPGMIVENYTARESGRKLHRLASRVWTKHWIEPAPTSPRILGDEVETQVHFHVENQKTGTVAGKELKAYRGWLWFKPSVISRLLEQKKGVLRWYTGDTGEVGPSRDQTLHFGVNSLGLINVLGYKMADLPEWAQKIWVADNLVPEGGLSEELHMSQNLARPASTHAPEQSLYHNLRMLQRECERVFGQKLFLELPDEPSFFRRIHRFHADSMESVCRLCKELHRTITEQIDLGGINAKIDPGNAEGANKEKLRQIKRIAKWMDTLGRDGRKITGPLAAVADLRQGDAHTTGEQLRAALTILQIPEDSKDYQKMSFWIIASVANCLLQIGAAINPAACPEKA